MKKLIFFKRMLLITVFVLTSALTFGANTPYGKLFLKSGSGYVIRDSKKIIATINKDLEILTDDLIRLEANSLAKLVSNEKATIELGSNAILKIKQWEEPNSNGFVNLLYGKIKATIAGLTSRESFNIKTANSVIGVKGTEYSAGVSVDGNSYAWTLENYIYLTDTVKKSQSVVPSGYYAANLKGSGIQKMIYVGKEIDSEKLNSSVIGTKSVAGGSESFYEKRDDIGEIPVLNIQRTTSLTNELNDKTRSIQRDSLIEVNFFFNLK